MLKVYLDAGLITENTKIFAHSIAPVFICKFLVQNKVKVKRLVFVCGFNNYFGIDEDYDDVNRGMYLENLTDVKNYNDPYVSPEAEKKFADVVATRQIMIDGGGHLNSESGYREFPELLEYI